LGNCARKEVSGQENKMNISGYLAFKLDDDITHLSSLFLETAGRTIENLFI
jgi:hypothetical protein